MPGRWSAADLALIAGPVPAVPAAGTGTPPDHSAGTFWILLLQHFNSVVKGLKQSSMEGNLEDSSDAVTPSSLSSSSSSSWEMIKQGAEARVYVGKFLERDVIIKERFPKSYRVPALDQKLTKNRMGQEARSMARSRRHGVRAPAVYHLDFERRMIFMEYITEGVLMKEYINSVVSDRDAVVEMMRMIGSVLARLHDANVIHGDLTTSNMIVETTSKQITLIDFGLSYVSALPEDKGVDLYVLERAFLSTHPATETLFQQLLDSYTAASKNSQAVVKKLDEVRLRGRKRKMIG